MDENRKEINQEQMEGAAGGVSYYDCPQRICPTHKIETYFKTRMIKMFGLERWIVDVYYCPLCDYKWDLPICKAPDVFGQ